MTDKITEKMNKELAVNKAQQDLDDVEYIPPILLPTKDAEISAKRTDINQKRLDHANGEAYIATRAQYIAIVQPLKNELMALIAENESIKTENRSRTGAAQAAYQAAQAPYKTVLLEKQAELDAFIAVTEIPLVILENPRYAIVEEFNVSEEKPLKVKYTMDTTEYHMWCYVSEDVKDAFIAGNLQIGDVVILIFVNKDSDKPLVINKVYKSWV